MTVVRHDGLKFRIYHIHNSCNNILVSYQMWFKKLYKAQHLSLPHFVNSNGTAFCECCQCCVCCEKELYYRILSVHALFHWAVQAHWDWFQECIRKFNDFSTRRTMHNSWVKQPAIKYTYSLWYGQIVIFKYVVPDFSRNSTANIISINNLLIQF
jgi:hypothetical protein